MAKQGNYVSVPGGSGPNPFKGVSDSLADLSKMYTDRETVSREEALARDKLANEQERWDIQNQRQQVVADRQTEAYNTKKAMDGWYKEFGSLYNPDNIRKQKAKKHFGVTDDQLTGNVGRKILDAVPIYQEDVADFYGKDFVKQFGTKFDPTAVKAHYGDLSALSALQAAENENAKKRFETAKFFIGKRIDAAGKLDPTGTAGTSKKGTSKIPKTYNDILLADLTKGFDGDSWPLFDSGKEDARDVAKYTLDVLKSAQNPDKTQKYSAAQAQVMTEFVLDRLRTGEDLKGIDDAKSKIAELIVDAEDGMTDSYKDGFTGSGGRKGNVNARAYLEGALSTKLDPNAFNPRDIRAIRRKAAQAVIDRLRGLTPTAPPQAATTRAATATQNRNWDLAAGKGPGKKSKKDAEGKDTKILTPRQKAINALPVTEEAKKQIRALPKGNQDVALDVLALEDTAAKMTPTAGYDPAAVLRYEQQQNKIEAEKQQRRAAASAVANRRLPKASQRAINTEAAKLMSIPVEYREDALKKLQVKYGGYGAGTVNAIRQRIREANSN